MPSDASLILMACAFASGWVVSAAVCFFGVSRDGKPTRLESAILSALERNQRTSDRMHRDVTKMLKATSTVYAASDAEFENAKCANHANFSAKSRKNLPSDVNDLDETLDKSVSHTLSSNNSRSEPRANRRFQNLQNPRKHPPEPQL
jgi:hypothetical protein